MQYSDNDKPTASQRLNEMNAISRGVERRLDLMVGFSAMVTLETVAIGQQLGMTDRQIERWAVSRSKTEFSTRGLNQSYPTLLKEGESDNGLTDATQW